MKLLHTPTNQHLTITDAQCFYLLKNGYAMNGNGKLRTDACRAYINYLIERI